MKMVLSYGRPAKMRRAAWLLLTGVGLGCAGTNPGSTAPVLATPVLGTAAAPPAFVMDSPAAVGGAEKGPVLAALGDELARAVRELREQDPAPYFVGYQIHDRAETVLVARSGSLLQSAFRRWRSLDTDVRVGDYSFDSTSQIDPGAGGGGAIGSLPLPIEDDAAALRAAAWLITERRYKAASERLIRLRSRKNVAVERDDKSEDFSRDKPVIHLEAAASYELDRPSWEARLRSLSLRFRGAPGLLDSQVLLMVESDTRSLLTSEGAMVRSGHTSVLIDFHARTRAEDGENLHLNRWFTAPATGGLPAEAELARTADSLIADLRALKEAPVAEPSNGPAILDGQAAAVFFHEIFGHRMEGHRQKSDGEAQTFAKKIGQSVMPSFISVYDDPRLVRLGPIHLNGSYRFDDEGVPAQRADLVSDGILKGFLLGRTPTRGFNLSNGHGRRQEGYSVVPRQANLVVQPSLTVPRAALVERLRAEARRQGKAYGLRFADIEGGFTQTARASTQAFKVLPIMVYRVYVDGRPDELIRGADIVGTPLGSLSRILAASDDYQVFNGVCGAESGRVRVSAVSPSLLVEQIEIQRKAKGQDRPPILPPPPLTPGGGA